MPLWIKAAVSNFWVNISNFFVLRNVIISKKSMVSEYREFSVFFHHASVFRAGKNLIASFLFAQSVTVICTLCPDWLVCAAFSNRWRWYELMRCAWLTLWLAHTNNRVSASHTVSGLELKLRWTSLPCCNSPRNPFVSVQTGLKRERETTNKIKHKPELACKTRETPHRMDDGHQQLNRSLFEGRLAVAAEQLNSIYCHLGFLTG